MDKAGTPLTRLPPGARDRLPLLVSLIGGVCALLFSLLVYPAIRESLGAHPDPDRLGELAGNLLGGKGFVYSSPPGVVPAFDRGPVYPTVVAAVYWVSGGPSLAAVQVMQAVFHGLTCWLVFILASRLASIRVALIAQSLCALHPMLLWYTSRIWIETISTSLVTAVVLALHLVHEQPHPGRGGAAGVLLGVASLTKSVLLPFSVIAAAFLLLQKGKAAAGSAATMLVLCAVVVLPWTVRNTLASGAFVPVHTGLGLNLIQGDVLAEHWTEMPFSSLALWELGRQKAEKILATSGMRPMEPGGDIILARASLEHSLAEPSFFLRRTVVNTITFLCLSESILKSLLAAALQMPLLLCVVIGSAGLWKRSPLARSPLLLVFYYVLVHALIFGWARFSLPLVPVSLVLAGCVMHSWRSRIRVRA